MKKDRCAIRRDKLFFYYKVNGGAETYIGLLTDTYSFEPIDTAYRSADSIVFKKRSGLTWKVVAGIGGGGGGGSGWGLYGNSGIDSATNRIGTTDAKPVTVIVNGDPAARFGSDGVFHLLGPYTNVRNYLNIKSPETGSSQGGTLYLSPSSTGVARTFSIDNNNGNMRFLAPYYGGFLQFIATPGVLCMPSDETSFGIRTSTPGAALGVNGNVKITDGTQGAGKVLTSDANGLASWQTPAAGGSVNNNRILFSADGVIKDTPTLSYNRALRMVG